MTPRRPARHVLDAPAQLRATSSPLAHRLLGALERLGPSTARQLGAQLERPPASLYYHLNRLAECGVLETETREVAGQRPETLFALAGRELVIRGDGSPAVGAELARSGRGLLRLAARLYAAAAERLGPTRARSRRRNLLIQTQARLSAADLAEVERRLEDVATYMAERDDSRRAPFHCLTVSLSPTTLEG